MMAVACRGWSGNGGLAEVGAVSTIPGDDSWADAGLVPPEDAEVPDPADRTVPVDPEHQPAAPRPDLRDEADEPDVVDQAREVPADEDEEYPDN
jgi:hypothetical protein